MIYFIRHGVLHLIVLVVLGSCVLTQTFMLTAGLGIIELTQWRVFFNTAYFLEKIYIITTLFCILPDTTSYCGHLSFKQALILVSLSNI